MCVCLWTYVENDVTSKVYHFHPSNYTSESFLINALIPCRYHRCAKFK